MVKYMEWLEVKFEGGSLKVCPECWWEDCMWWAIGDDAGRVAPFVIATTFEPFTMDDFGNIVERYGCEAYDAVKAALSVFARHLGEVRRRKPDAGMWDIVQKTWPGRVTEPQYIGCTVARFIKETFDKRVEEVSSILPSPASVPGRWVVLKEDTSGVWAARPEMLKAAFQGQPKWYRAVWALMTFDSWGDLNFNHLTPEDVVEDALICPKIPGALR